MSWPTAASSRGTAPWPWSVGTRASPASSSRPPSSPASRRRASTCCSLGVLPTPGVAYLTDRLGADLGVMLSASHNPMPDNGIKFLARGGHKLDDAIEIAIERRMGEPWERPTGGDVGRVTRLRVRGRASTPPTSCSTIDAPAGGAQGRARLRRGRRLRGGPAGAGGRRCRRSSRSTPSPTASTSTTTAAPRTSSRCRRPSLEHGAARRLRARRRRRPLPGRRPRGQRRRRRPDPRDPRPRRCASRAGSPRTPSSRR